jgi:hypothetical protein
MDSVSPGLVIVLLAGWLWLMGAVLQWHNIRRQEKLIARLRRLSPRRVPAAPAAEEVVGRPESQPVGEDLRPANRWTVG